MQNKKDEEEEEERDEEIYCYAHATVLCDHLAAVDG